MTSFAGRWLTTFGTMDLTQDGAAVRGTYQGQGPPNPIEGTVAGNRLTFRYREAAEEGEGWFELTRYGRFVGRYRPAGSFQEFDWSGSREWDGVWETSFGRLALIQEADRVFGFYEGAGSSSVEGRLEGGRLVFRIREPSAAGEGWFDLAPDAGSFAGLWRPDGAAGWGQWAGRRVRPTPGLTYLMVIEAHWQQSIAEHEYSFGNMLREFLARLPHVAVRQRFFNDAASLERWCRELMYFPEPAVVMIASHGMPQQLSVLGRHISARLVVDSLRHAPNIKLLHFSSCLILKEQQAGDFARHIEPRAPFPISGYTTSVDWGGSAIIEFNYLDLILGKGLAPREAAEVLPRLVGYAGDDAPPGSPYPGAGFRFFDPGQ